MEILDQIVFREMVREALRTMTGYELLLAAGRASGMSDQELADLVNVEPAAVSYQLGEARKRIVEAIPELRVTLSGRCRRGGERAGPHREALYSLEEAAERMGVTAGTVAMWVQEGKLAGAYKFGKRWWVPAADLAEIERWRDGEMAGEPMESIDR